MVDPTFTALATPRLRLRRFRSDDVRALAAYRSDPDVARHQSWDRFPEEDARELVREMRTRHPGKPGEWFQIAIGLGPQRELIGDLGFHVLRYEPKQADIGYTLSRAHQGRGYATEAVRRLLQYAFDRLGLHRVIAGTDVENARSIALLERIGFRREGTFVESEWLKGRWCSEHRYAILDREWHEVAVRV